MSEQTSLRRERNEAQRRVEELRAERDALAGVINANFTKGSSVSPNLNRTNNSQLQVQSQGSIQILLQLSKLVRNELEL